MQLILNKELINRKDNKIKSNIVIVSTRKWVIEKISEKYDWQTLTTLKKLIKIFLIYRLLIPLRKLSVLLLISVTIRTLKNVKLNKK